MRANIYVLTEARGSSFDVWMACGTQDEALEYYRKISGRPGHVSQTEYRDGHSILVVDADDTGAAYVAQYKVGLVEILDAE